MKLLFAVLICAALSPFIASPSHAQCGPFPCADAAVTAFIGDVLAANALGELATPTTFQCLIDLALAAENAANAGNLPRAKQLYNLLIGALFATPTSNCLIDFDCPGGGNAFTSPKCEASRVALANRLICELQWAEALSALGLLHCGP